MVQAVRVLSLVPSLNLSFADLRIRHPLCHVVRGAGAIYALASFFAFAAPNARFLLFFVVPMPAWACIGAIACFDVYNAFTRRVRAETPSPSHALSLRLFLCTVLHFRLGRTRRRTNGWRPLLDDANKI